MPFMPLWPSWPDKCLIANSLIQLEFNFQRDNMGRRTCKHCPTPGCGSKYLVRLANHLTQVHELTELERKYWLQFAKLQNTNAIRVYDKETEPKTIFFINECGQLKLVSCKHGPKVETSPGGGGDSHLKQTGMLVVSLRGVNFGLWSRLGCSGQSANILSRQSLV